MFSRDNWKEIFETIQKNKLRTFLSGFTVALGILIFVVLFGFGNGLINTFDDFFSDDATNTFFIFPGRTSMPYKGYKSNRQIEFDNSSVAFGHQVFTLGKSHQLPGSRSRQRWSLVDGVSARAGGELSMGRVGNSDRQTHLGRDATEVLIKARY